jgi:uncharacterized protein (DUF427 family)
MHIMDRRSRIVPMPGQESVWDYPRPPRIEATDKHIRVVFNGLTIADTRRALRVLETSHPPVYYIPPEDIKMEYLNTTDRHSFCEFKGVASYYSIRVEDKTATNAAWYYANPVERYAALRDYVAFYAGKVDACYVDDEQVRPQEGSFYGGWITSDIAGPFKGNQG